MTLLQFGVISSALQENGVYSNLVLVSIDFDSSCMSKNLVVRDQVGLSARIPCTAPGASSWCKDSTCITLCGVGEWLIYSNPVFHSVSKFSVA